MTEAIIAKPEPRISHTVAMELLAAVRECVSAWEGTAFGTVYEMERAIWDAQHVIKRAEQELSQ